jgi:pimeloyl-ACP methyl ester carboxylesterase
MPHATINGITLAYTDQGQGLPVLLVHAFPTSSAIWQQQIDALSDRYRIIAPDLRGFGASDAPPGPYPMELYADDLAALLDELAIDQAVFVGVSMGGYIAFAMLRRHAARLRGLVLACTRPQADSDEGRAGREQSAQQTEQQGPTAITAQMLLNLLSDRAPAELRQRLHGIITANSRQGLAGALRGMALRPDSTDLLAQISVPTLVLAGAEDKLTPAASVGTDLHEQIPNSQFAILPDAGHLANLEQPAAFTAELERFLATL